ASGPEPVHEHAVGGAVLARRGVDADDPETAEVALLVLAADIGVDACLLGGLPHELVELALVLEVALGELGELLALLTTNDSTLDARHGWTPFAIGGPLPRNLDPDLMSGPGASCRGEIAPIRGPRRAETNSSKFK